MPKKIEAQSEDAQLKVESKRLRRLLKQLRDEFDDMAAAKKWALVKRVMIILVRIELQRSRRD
jgi:hypothetical protein